MIKLGKFIFLLLVTPLLLCCNLPKDPEETLEKVKGDTLKVGITNNPPWTDLSAAAPAGVEVKMVKEIARMLEAEIKWFKGGGPELFEALKAKELHLVIGGLSEKNPWSKHIGFTNPYKATKIYVGVPPGENPPDNIDHLPVGVKSGAAIAGYVRKKGGQPVGVTDLKNFNGLVAAPEWELQQTGYTATDIKLHEVKHVFAVIKGENAWVMFLEKFFNSHQQQIEQWLKEADHEKNKAI